MFNRAAMSGNLRQHFNELSGALMDLHKALLMLEAKRLEAQFNRKVNPYELLHASLNDPTFAWLRVMSELIVSIDTLIDETPNLSAQEAHRVSAQVLDVLESNTSEFWKHYSDYMSNDPDIIMKHARVKTALGLMRPDT